MDRNTCGNGVRERYAAAVFKAEDRERVRSRLLEWARADKLITGAAITGSGAQGGEDDWSDIDLIFGIEGADPMTVLGDWTRRMQGEFEALDLFDLRSGATIYRVFLLPTGLEVDLAVAPAAEFGATGPHFRTIFGAGVDRPHPHGGHLLAISSDSPATMRFMRGRASSGARSGRRSTSFMTSAST
ncbi:MAG: hypothetical protein M3Y62_07880 [Candidatus Dormibacteraeota bacterium]|nr:hypothetical protein [Candidatus Dormibacteraeota bacterium]